MICVRECSGSTALISYSLPMKDNQYPRTVTFETANPEGFTPVARSWLERLRREVRMTMPAENILRIEYPSDIVEQIRSVNVDGCIYRLDFISPGNRFFMCNCVFPSVPWNRRDFMNNRWPLGRRTEAEGVLTVEYPEKGQKTLLSGKDAERMVDEFLRDCDAEIGNKDNCPGFIHLRPLLEACVLQGAEMQRSIDCRVKQEDIDRAVRKFCRENDLNYRADEAYDLIGSYTNEDLKELVAEAIEYGFRSAKKEK